MNKIYNILQLITTLFVLLIGKTSLYGQEIYVKSRDSSEIMFYFRLAEIDIDESYMSNSESFSQLDSLLNGLDSSSIINSIALFASSSPEGKYNYNLHLAEERILSFQKLLLNLYPSFKDLIVKTDAYVMEWSKLVELIKNDVNVPFKSSVMDILSSNRSIEVISWLLKHHKGGVPWQYLRNNHFCHLRNGGLQIKFAPKEILPNKVVQDSIRNTKLVNHLTVVPIDTLRLKIIDLPEISVIPTPEIEKIRKDLFAVKTNLLFDAISLINIEFEVPFLERWSVAGELIFPWWTWDNGKSDSKRNRMQLLNVNLEGRYWFGDRSNRPQMTGWFAGVYVGGGLYDFEYKAKGYQGELLISGGISGGYAHAISKRGNLRMEYSLQIGYMETDYMYYKSHFDHTGVWHSQYDKEGRYSWIGPTKIKISLVWMLNKRKVGR